MLNDKNRYGTFKNVFWWWKCLLFMMWICTAVLVCDELKLMFVLYWCLKKKSSVCPDACPMVRHENEHNERRERETMEETLSDMHAQSHYNTNTDAFTNTHSDTDNSSSFASLQLCTNKALILYMHSLYLPLPINTLMWRRLSLLFLIGLRVFVPFDWSFYPIFFLTYLTSLVFLLSTTLK